MLYLSCFRTEGSGPKVPSAGDQHANRCSLVAARLPGRLPGARAKNQQQLHRCRQRAAPVTTERGDKGLIAGLPLDQLLERPERQRPKTPRGGLGRLVWMKMIRFFHISASCVMHEASLKLFCTRRKKYRQH